MIQVLQSAVIHIAPFVAVMSLVVTVHELGHFLSGKVFGVAIESFSIGFGPPIFSWTDRSGVAWRVAWLPIGGYVKFAGDVDETSVPDEAALKALRSKVLAEDGPRALLRYLQFRPVWQRACVSAAGPVSNFILAVALFAGFLLIFGKFQTPPRVLEVQPGAAAQRAGVQKGDLILSVDGRATPDFSDLRFYVQYRPGVPITLKIDRDGQVRSLVMTPDHVKEASAFGGQQDVGQLGLMFRPGGVVRVGPGEAVVLGAKQTFDIAATTLFYMGRMLTGKVGADQLHSFIGIATASGQVTQQAVDAAHTAGVNWVMPVLFGLMQMAALLSVSVGVLNLLPIPVLDGGHLLSYLYEAVARRPPAAVVQAVGYRAGLALLVGLMLFATWNDLGRERVFHLFGGLFS